MEVGIHYGALCDKIVDQVKAQGFAFKNERTAETMQKLADSLIMCHIYGVITDSQYDVALKKLNKMIAKNLVVEVLDKGETNV